MPTPVPPSAATMPGSLSHPEPNPTGNPNPLGLSLSKPTHHPSPKSISPRPTAARGLRQAQAERVLGGVYQGRPCGTDHGTSSNCTDTLAVICSSPACTGVEGAGAESIAAIRYITGCGGDQPPLSLIERIRPTFSPAARA